MTESTKGAVAPGNKTRRPNRLVALVIIDIDWLATSHGSRGSAQRIKGKQRARGRQLVLHSPVFSNTQAARLLGNIDIGT